MLTENWKKSTRSNPSGNCVEARWKKSSRSGSTLECVEVRGHGGTIQVRDSKDQGTGPELSFTPGEWTAFIEGVKTGEFDLP